MASYSVRFKRSAERELRSVPRKELARLVGKIRALARDPRSHGSIKLSGEEAYRIRQGDWRVVYEIDDENRRVMISRIGHRRDVYR